MGRRTRSDISVSVPGNSITARPQGWVVLTDLLDRVFLSDDEAIVARFHEPEVAARQFEVELAVMVVEADRRTMCRAECR